MYITETFGNRRKICASRAYLNMWSPSSFLLLPCHPASQAGEDCVAELPSEVEAVQHPLPLRLPPLRSSACLKRMTWRECHCSAPRCDPSVKKINQDIQALSPPQQHEACSTQACLKQVCSVDSPLSTSQDDPTNTVQFLNRGGKKSRCQRECFQCLVKADGLRYWEQDMQLEIYYRKVLPKPCLLSKLSSVKSHAPLT